MGDLSLDGRRRLFLIALAGLATGRRAAAAAPGPPRPGPRDLCPVCGMLVSKYPGWIATVEHDDGRFVFFDGAKDLFKYLFAPERYSAARPPRGVRRRWVTEFYGLSRIDAGKAFYVVGSDVLGPMGHELVPLASREEAEEFRADHEGRRILTFAEVGRDLPGKLDAGRFE